MLPKHDIVYKCRGNYWEIRSSDDFFFLEKSNVLHVKLFEKKAKERFKELIHLLASMGTFK